MTDLTLAQIEEGLRLWRAASDQPLWAETNEARALQKVLPVLFPAALTMAAECVRLRQARTRMDCRYTLGNVADISGSHCPLNDPCDRCYLETQRDEARRELRELREILRSAPIAQDGNLRAEYVLVPARIVRSPTPTQETPK